MKLSIYRWMLLTMALGGITTVPKIEAQTSPAQTGMVNLAGSRSSVKSPKQYLINDDKAWAALWKQHLGSEKEVPPKVDFTKYTIVAAFAGMKTTGGYNLKFGAIVRSKFSAEVEVILEKPAPGSMVTQALTYPFVVRTVDKLPKNTKFKLIEQIRQ